MKMTHFVDQMRREFLNLTEALEDWEWKENGNFDKYDSYYYLGNGVTELPESGCEATQTFCDVANTFTSVKDCVLCEIKVLYFEPKSHFRPFVGPTNAK